MHARARGTRPALTLYQMIALAPRAQRLRDRAPLPNRDWASELRAFSSKPALKGRSHGAEPACARSSAHPQHSV